MKTRVYYVEDEPALGRIVKESLEKAGYEVRWETDGARVLKAFNGYHPDIVVLDIMLPHLDGYALCEEIRSRFPRLPILFLTAKGETDDLVRGFESGGTEYLKKPFSLKELIVRIENQLNLHQDDRNGGQREEQEVNLGAYRFIPSKYELFTPSKVIKLSQREHQILQILVDHQNRVTDRQSLLLSVWGDDSFFNSRNLDVYIRKLRKHFEEDPAIQIKTIKGSGYLFIIDD